MKLYHEHTYEKLGMDVILERVAGYVHSEEALQYFAELQPSKQARWISEELEITDEFRNLVEFDSPFPNEKFPSLGPVVGKLKVEGNWLSREELWNLSGFYKSVRRVQNYLKSRVEEYPRLAALVKEAQFDQKVAADMAAIFDDRGVIVDEASLN